MTDGTDDLGTAFTVVLGGRTWALDEQFIAHLSRWEGKTVSLPRASRPRLGGTQRAGNISIVPLKGIITPQPSLLSLIFGGGDASLESFRANLRSALGEPDTDSILLDIDSPGGVVDGVSEMADELYAARQAGGKPIVAISHHLMASAAYYLGSQAHEVVVSPSAEVGSIGVYQQHTDVSEANKKAGTKITFIKAGKFKTEGHPFAPLDDEATAHLQQGVDDYYDPFVNAVARGRSHPTQPVSAADVRDGYGQGRVLTAKRAVAANLADREATIEQTLDRLADGRSRVRRAPADRRAEDERGGVTATHVPADGTSAPTQATDPHRGPDLLSALRNLRR